MGRYKNIQWVVQSNLISQPDFEGLKNACDKIDVKFVGIHIIPFTDSLPYFERNADYIIYGSTTFNNLAFKHKELCKGVFFDEESFSIENYNAKWKCFMLNYSAIITTFKALINHGKYEPGKPLFIRPNDDSKSFAGEVKRFGEIEEWYKKLVIAENTNLSSESKIVVSEPYSIQYEWRLWIVNKKVIAASKYREYFRLKKERGCLVSVIQFAEERCREYTPHDVFVMDVCLCGDDYYIVECNCMNGAGFYNANIESIVSGVTEYFLSQFN